MMQDEAGKDHLTRRIKTRKYRAFRNAGSICFVVLFLTLCVYSQRLAVIEPRPNDDHKYAKLLAERLRSADLRVVDDAAAESAFGAAEITAPFNLAADEARQIGAAIGCDYFILVKAETQRRSSFRKSVYYESTAAIFIVSSRSGQLVKWILRSSEKDTPKDALAGLTAMLPIHAAEIKDIVTGAFDDEITNNAAPINGRSRFEILDKSDPADKTFRSPAPYKRIKPAYTPTAYLFSVSATVDAEVDIDEKGNILRVEIVRWAGYGLDESVSDAIRSMNWRPAERNGKTLPMRVLLRYNFKKIEKDDEDDDR